MTEVITQASSCLEAAIESAARQDFDAVIDDVLAARLLVTTLLHALAPSTER